MRASSRLIKAVRKIYGEQFGVIADFEDEFESKKTMGRRDRSRSNNRKVSEQGSSQTSPKRKDSLSKKDRYSGVLHFFNSFTRNFSF